MEKDKNTSLNYSAVWILYSMIGGVLWIALIVAKACGIIKMNWPAVLLGIIWIPALVLAFILAAAGAIALTGRAVKRHKEWKRRRKIARTLWEAMEGLTLNSVGPVYGVKRQQGERNQSYKRRISKAARTLDTVNLQNVPKQATGEKLDRVAKRHGLKRRPGESNEQLNKRIWEVLYTELKGDGVHDRV